jgi:hypothetical protein
MIDATPVRNRVFQWLAFVNRIEAELYYEADLCWYTACGSSPAPKNPWQSVYAFGGNGDGTLMYPGCPVGCYAGGISPDPTTAIGGTTPIPLASIRLKHIRDGMEDFEYLQALSNRGQDAFARATAASFIANAYTFSNDPQALTNARQALGDELHRLSLPPCSQRAWSLCAHDFNGNTFSDILLQTTSNGIGMWLMNSAAAIAAALGVGTLPSGWSIVGQRDLNGDGFSDLLLRHAGGSVGEWLMNGATITAANGLGNPTTSWVIVGTGDFNKDSVGDILWRGGGTAVAIWYMNSSGGFGSAVGVGSLPNDWTIAGTGDFDGDGVLDILWNHTSGAIAVWLMNSNGTIKSPVGLGTLPPPPGASSAPATSMAMGSATFSGLAAEARWRSGS